jgi:spore coat protein A
MLCPVKLYYPYTWGGFDGDTPVVNGKVYPYFEVKPQAYRFRFLNGCNSRYVSFSLPHGPTMWQVRVTNIESANQHSLIFYAIASQIGTDGGFLNKAIEVQNLTLGSSERADVIIDFRGYEGRSLILTNLAGQPYPSGTPSIS